MTPKFFATQDDFRKWLEANHAKQDELLVGFYKKDSGKPSMTWSESVDQALCFGWIDGVRKRRDDESYTIRFTPRRAKSTWSTINIAKVAELKKKKLMQPAGLAAFDKRQEANSNIYAYENSAELSGEYLASFRRHGDAWEFFLAQPPSYRRFCAHHVMSAKQEKTRRARLDKIIDASKQRTRI